MSFKWKTDKNWKRFQTMLEIGRVNAATNKFFTQAVLLNGYVLEKFMRDTIRSGNFEANAALTIALKGENKPLIGIEAGAQLFGSITTERITPTMVFVGTLRTNDFYNVAYMIHEGRSEGGERGIRVTDKMRGLFLVLARASQGKHTGPLSPRAKFLLRHMRGEFYPLHKSTTKIIIPPRRWVNQTLKNPALWKIMKKNYTIALKMALEEMRKGVV